jgi:hypothetical protein
MLRDEHLEQDLESIVILRQPKDLAYHDTFNPGHRSFPLASPHSVMPLSSNKKSIFLSKHSHPTDKIS